MATKAKWVSALIDEMCYLFKNLSLEWTLCEDEKIKYDALIFDKFHHTLLLYII